MWEDGIRDEEKEERGRELCDGEKEERGRELCDGKKNGFM